MEFASPDHSKENKKNAGLTPGSLSKLKPLIDKKYKQETGDDFPEKIHPPLATAANYWPKSEFSPAGRLLRLPPLAMADNVLAPNNFIDEAYDTMTQMFKEGDAKIPDCYNDTCKTIVSMNSDISGAADTLSEDIITNEEKILSAIKELQKKQGDLNTLEKASEKLQSAFSGIRALKEACEFANDHREADRAAEAQARAEEEEKRAADELAKKKALKKKMQDDHQAQLLAFGLADVEL
tara:strand:+ start:823 stop:1536 length:714 start_codon:yes stop_codon:yes gene_type:complete